MDIEKDPNGIKQHDPGAKLDNEKPMVGLLQYFGLALLEVSKVGTFGANKYTRGGWQHVTDGVWRYTNAMGRHWLQEGYDELDNDSQMYHMAQTAWNALARLELFLRGKQKCHHQKTTKETTSKKEEQLKNAAKLVSGLTQVMQKDTAQEEKLLKDAVLPPSEEKMSTIKDLLKPAVLTNLQTLQSLLRKSTEAVEESLEIVREKPPEVEKEVADAD